MQEILQANEALAGQALRTLGVAGLWLPADVLADYAATPDARVEQDLVFAGLIGMIDPPRREAKEAVARAKGAGIRPLMITGDHPRTAAVIAQELGIAEDGRAITGGELEKLSEAGTYPNRRRGLRLRARQPRTQTAHHRGAAAEWSGRGDDGRRRQ